MAKFKVLFLCKKRIDSYGVSFGLLNSASMLCKVLNRAGIEAEVACPIDANGIDREVYTRKPTHVIIHALWVTPEKIFELCRRYPGVSWNIRIHSKPPFLAMEGMASTWIGEYAGVQHGHHNLWMSANSIETDELMRDVFKAKSVMLPNAYVKPERTRPPDDSFLVAKKFDDHRLNIACFGAIRPLKNHYAQAAAAIRFADSIGMWLDFHINKGREEQGGDRVIKNLHGMFDDTHHRLIEHDWYPHEVLVHDVLPRMSLGMQVSMTETFNIVAADMVAAGIPTVGSEDIYWMSCIFHADPNNLDQIARKLGLARLLGRFGVWLNTRGLAKSSEQAVHIWSRYLAESEITQ